MHLIQVSKTDSTKRIYQDGMVRQAMYLLAEYLDTFALSVASSR